MTLLHLGGLHALELPFVALLSFGPLIAVVVVVLLIRRQDEQAEREELATQAASSSSRANIRLDQKDT